MKPIVAIAILFSAWIGVSDGAQVSQPPRTPAATTPATATGGNLGHVVADLARATKFYRDVLGLQVSPAASVTPPWGGPKTTGATVSMPGATWVLELVQAPAGATPFRPLMQDRGALTMIFNVQNVDAILERALAANTPVASTAGGVVAVAGRGGITRATTIQAPDGEFMELLQPWEDVPPDAPPSGPGVVSLVRAVRLTVTDANAAAEIYRNLLDVDFRGGPQPVGDPGVQFMVGLPGKKFQLRISRTGIAGSNMIFEVFEAVGLSTTSGSVQVQSPGTSFLRVSVPPGRAAGLATSSEVANLLLVQPAK